MQPEFTELRRFVGSGLQPHYEEIITEITTRVAKGAERSQINSFYYELFEGVLQEDIRSVASLFFKKNKDELFKNKAVLRLIQHLERNDLVVLVSGAMPDILEPIAMELGVNKFLCSTPEVVNGKYTGKLLQQSIGENKAKLIKQYSESLGIDIKDCAAYGDHISDLAMLESVGFPCVVDPEESFKKIVESKNWEIL